MEIDMGTDNNTSRIRDADWIFNALWTACGDESIPKLVLNFISFYDLYSASLS